MIFLEWANLERLFLNISFNFPNINSFIYHNENYTLYLSAAIAAK